MSDNHPSPSPNPNPISPSETATPPTSRGQALLEALQGFDDEFIDAVHELRSTLLPEPARSPLELP
jgi:hypothetical protein